MKIHNIGMATLLAALLGSCSQNTMDDSIPEAKGKKIDLITQIAPTTRTSTTGMKTVFTEGDQIGVFGLVREDASTILNSNLKYQLDNKNNWGTEAPIILPIDGSNVNFYAYYPFVEMGSENVNTTFDFSVDADQATNGYNTSDLLLAKNESIVTSEADESTAIELSFAHAFALVEVEVTLPEGVTPEKVILKAFNLAKVDLVAQKATVITEGQIVVEGEVGENGEEVTKDIEEIEISLQRQEDGKFRCVVPVQTIKGKCIRITGSNGAPYWYTADADVALEANKLNTFTVTAAN